MKLRRKKKAPVKTFAEMTPEEKQTQMEKLAYLFERMRLGDYVNNFNRPWRVIYMSLIGGIARGVGLTIGATIVIVVLIKICMMLISWNIPYLTGALQNVVQIVKTTPGLGKVSAVIEAEETGKTVDEIIQEKRAQRLQANEIGRNAY